MASTFCLPYGPRYLLPCAVYTNILTRSLYTLTDQ